MRTCAHGSLAPVESCAITNASAQQPINGRYLFCHEHCVFLCVRYLIAKLRVETHAMHHIAAKGFRSHSWFMLMARAGYVSCATDWTHVHVQSILCRSVSAETYGILAFQTRTIRRRSCSVPKDSNLPYSPTLMPMVCAAHVNSAVCRR